jgi:DNA-binding NarL/FixJ family response regulator
MQSDRRVVVVEDEPVVAELLGSLVEGTRGLALAGIALNLSQAKALLANEMPDLVILDLCLPDGDGWTLIDRSATGSSRFVVVTGRLDEATFVRAHRASLLGFVHKLGARLSDWRAALQSFAVGRSYWSPMVLDAMERLCRYRCPAQGYVDKRDEPLLALLGSGATDAESAQVLRLTSSSAKTARHRLLARLGFHSSIELMRWACRTGWARFGPCEPLVSICGLAKQARSDEALATTPQVHGDQRSAEH